MAEALVPPLTDDPVGVLSSGPLLNLTRANLACGVVLTLALETSGKVKHLPHGPWGLGRKAVPGLGLSGRNRG